jgi:cysteinyl-tRNA synthetase
MVRFTISLTLCLWYASSLTEAWVPQSILNKHAIRPWKSDSRIRVASEEEDAVILLPEIMLYNSKTRCKEPLKPLVKSRISMYTCGPTVYDYAHVGNFRAFLTYDLIKRALLYVGYDVTHICNLTDVDDKIINRANEQGISNILDLTIKFEKLFFKDLEALNIKLADKYPRATEHIEEMMEMILELQAKDLAYETPDGSWYFATQNKDGYGQQLVQLNWDEMETTERGESSVKRNPQDFCLWKAFKPGVDREDAAWSSAKIQKGRPGWHLECSAMSRKYLGDTIDIHGGGIDLKFPHHENEIAQSEGVSGKTFCNCWLHNGFVNINDDKMSKSLGNFLTLRGACPTSQEVRAYRYLVMSSQYRNPLSFTTQVTEAAKSALKRIDAVKECIEQALKEKDGSDASSCKQQSNLANEVVPKALENFDAALLDDLSMPRAAAALFALVKEAENEFKRVAKQKDGDDGAAPLDLEGLEAVSKAMDQMDKVFGIFYEVPMTREEVEAVSDEQDDSLIPTQVLELVVQRTEAKEAKDWDLADSLRSRITELGFKVKDVKGGNPIVSRVAS